MNRCSGLLFAKERLQREPFTSGDADFVGRNLAKAGLAIGDAVLTVRGQYHWSCRERDRRLKQSSNPDNLPWFAEAQEHHAAGVEFKLHPVRAETSRAQLLGQHEGLTALGLQIWLWLESRRLNRRFRSARDYAFTPINKCPETNAWRNRAISAAQFGPATLLSANASRYPRERLLNTLAMLLWEPSFLSDPVSLRWAQSNLRTDAETFSAFVRAYTALWCHFS
jgi:hypothetical protein